VVGLDADVMGLGHDQRAHKRLWAAALMVGLQDAADAFFKVSQLRLPQDHFEPLRWINSDSNAGGSFVWMCDALDMHPDAVRMRWRMNLRGFSARAKAEDARNKKKAKKDD
jgi:hypothetical protein